MNNNTATLREIYSRAHAVGIGGDLIQIKDLRKNKNTSHWQLTVENRQTASGGQDVVAMARVMAAKQDAAADAGHAIYPGQAFVFNISADVSVIELSIQGVQPADWTTEDAVTVQVTLTEEVFSPACRAPDNGPCKPC